MKRILIYNWTQFDDLEGRGGGVRIYEGNIIQELVSRNYDVFHLSSGLSYTFFKRRPFYSRAPEKSNIACVKKYEIVNSEVTAPAINTFLTPELSLEASATHDAFRSFMLEHGPFDIVWFNNFEGLPISIVSLKGQFPECHFMFMAHNYYVVCPQVNLWRNENKNCSDFDNGLGCISCAKPPSRQRVINANILSYLLRRIGIVGNSKFFRIAFRIASKFERFAVVCRLTWDKVRYHGSVQPSSALASFDGANLYKYRRLQVAKLLNENLDSLVFVSQRTKFVCEKFGISSNRSYVQYIGTSFFQGRNDRVSANRIGRREEENIRFTICYLGYARRDKGFYFLLDALGNIPSCISNNVTVKLVAKMQKSDLKLIDSIAPRFFRIETIDGYSHKDLKMLLSNVDLGVIPVLWEDNLPQVALEFLAHQVPILASDLGGASETNSNRDYLFENNNIQDFVEKLIRFAKDPNYRDEYWKTAQTMPSIGEHIDDIEMIWSKK